MLCGQYGVQQQWNPTPSSVLFGECNNCHLHANTLLTHHDMGVIARCNRLISGSDSFSINLPIPLNTFPSFASLQAVANQTCVIFDLAEKKILVIHFAEFQHTVPPFEWHQQYLLFKCLFLSYSIEFA